jgi:hypothetical protein
MSDDKFTLGRITFGMDRADPAKPDATHVAAFRQQSGYSQIAQFDCGKHDMHFERSRCPFCELDVLSAQLDLARGALADIGWSDDMTLETAVSKARRIYKETADAEGRAELEVEEARDRAADKSNAKD